MLRVWSRLGEWFLSSAPECALDMRDTVWLLTAAKAKWKAGDLAEAERMCRAVLAKDPTQAQAARLLGEALLDRRRNHDAHEVVSIAARARPLDGELRNLMGRCSLGIGQIPEARVIFESIFQRDPASLPAKVGMALCAVASRQAAEAAAKLRTLLPTNGTDPFLNAALAQAYFTIGSSEESIGHYRAAIRVRPALTWRAELGWALHMVKRYAEALQELDAVLAADPRLELAISGKAEVLIELQREDEARLLLAAALNQGGLDDSLVITHARLAKTPEQRAQARRFLERRLTLIQGRSQRVALLFSLGKLKDADGEHDAAFECYQTANDYSGPPISAASTAQSFSSIMTVFSRENLERIPRPTTMDSLPLFIVGMPRSGTSLVEQILASHPDVFGAGELPDLNRICAELPALRQPPGGGGIGFPGGVLCLTRGDVERIGSGYLQKLRAKSGDAKVATDKMPWNFVYCGLIDILFPGAKIIHCRRNPLDTCVSIYATAFNESHAYKNDLGNLAATYREYVRLMDHWRATLRVPMLEVRYEEVVKDPQAQARRLVEFAGLPWDDRCLKFYENRRSIGTASVEQVRRPVYDTSIGRWKKYQRHLGSLMEGLRGVE